MTRIDRRAHIPGLPDTTSLAYSQVVAAGNLVFVAGQAGVDESGRLVSPEFIHQARRTFENVARALMAARCTLHDVVTMTVFITDWRYGPDLVSVRGEVFGDQLPASAMVAVAQLAYPEMLVDVQCTAMRQEA